MCLALNISRSGYYQWRCGRESKRSLENARLLQEIKRIYWKSRGLYGSPRITEELRSDGTRYNKKRVARLMRENRIRSKTRKKYKVTTHSKHGNPVTANLIHGCFETDDINKLWLSDITYVKTDEGWMYLAAILDAYSREIVGWSLDNRLTKNLVLRALSRALLRQKPGRSLIFHSDRGSQYASYDVQRLLRDHNITPSMSSTGNCYDNAMMESFFHTLKTECVYLENYHTREEAKQNIFEYIEIFYNRKRRHSALSYKTPAEYRKLTNHP